MKGKIFLIALIASVVASTASYASEANNYSLIFKNATEEDYRALEKVVFNESACCNCSHDVNVAVVETVLNRVLSDEWPDTIYGVCTQKGQFVCKSFTADSAQWELISDAIQTVVNEGRTVLPGTDYIYFATKRQSCAKDHIKIGGEKRHTYMWFGRKK